MVNYDKIIELAKEHGLSFSYLSEKLGMSKNYLKDCKRNDSDISDERLNIIAASLGCAPEYLRDREKVIINEKLNEWALEAADSLTLLSQKTNVSPTAAMGWIRGISDGYMEHIPDIAELLGMSIDELIGKKTLFYTLDDFPVQKAYNRASPAIQEAVKKLLEL